MPIPLPLKTLFLWLIRAFVLSLAFGAFFCFLIGIRAAFIVSSAFILLTFIYLPLFYKTCKITLRNSSIEFAFGVIIGFEIIMPKNKIIFTERLTSPLARLFCLNAVILKSTRGFLFIPEIAKNTRIF